MSREGAKARPVQRDPRGDIASYPAHGSEGGQQAMERVAGQACCGVESDTERGWEVGSGWVLGQPCLWDPRGGGPRRKLTTQREPGDSRASLMQPFKKQ